MVAGERVYNRGARLLLDAVSGASDVSNLRALLLVTSGEGGSAFNRLENFVSQLSGEAAGAGRITLSGVSVAQNTSGAEAAALSVVFPAVTAGQTVGAAVVYRFVTNDADSELVSYYNLGELATTGKSFRVNWSSVASGVFRRVSTV